MTCREASNLLPLFFDGELDPRQMRSVALHGTRCQPCEAELRRMERLQELVSETVSAGVDEIDLSNFWTAVERRLGATRPSWWQRMRARWQEGELRWAVRIPAFAAAAAVAVLAFFLFTRTQQPSAEPGAPQIAALDHSASIDSLDTDLDAVAVLDDPETSTTALWVSDDKTEAVP